MTVQFTDEGKQIFMSRLTTTPHMGISPFFEEDGKLYLRFDAISIKLKTGYFSGGRREVEIGYAYKGETIMGHPLMVVGEGDILNLQGVEGRLEITMSF
jgi:cation transporter-like permease